MTKSKSVVCIGHRGAMGHETQNTLAAINKGYNLGATWVEVDLYCIAEELVLFHDRRLERLTTSTGLISDLTLAEIQKLTLSGGHTIPTLRQALEIAKVRGGINIELKGSGCAIKLSSVLSDYKNSGGDLSKVLVSSFNHSELELFKRALPEVRCGALFYGEVTNEKEYLSALNPYSVNYSIEFVTQKNITNCKEWGYRTIVYTVNHRDDVERLIEWGVDGIISDVPDVVVSTLRDFQIALAKDFL